RLTECELGKMWDHTAAVKKLLGEHVRVFFVRLNRDEYDGGAVSLDDRVAAFGAVVRNLLTADVSAYSPLHPYVRYMYYHSKCAFQIAAARARPDSIVVLDE